MENTYTGKKMSVSGSSTTTHRKASTKGRSHFKSHSSGGYSSGEDDRVRAIVATDVTASAPVTEPAVVATQISETASKVAAVMGVGIEMSDDIASRAQTAEIPTAYEETGDGDDAYGGDIDGGSHETSRLHEGLDLQMYLNQMDGTSETALSLPTSMPTLFDPAAVPNSSSDKEKASPAQNAITLEGSRPASSQAGAKADNSRVGTASEKDKRADVRTPTLSERADRLQLSTPLPPLQPDVFAALTAVEGIDSHHTTGSGSAGGAGGLRAMLKRNIEASAMAVYHLQDQQQRRDQLGSSPSIDSAAGVVVGKVGLYKRNANGDIAAISQHGSGNVHPPSRLKPSSHAKNIRNARHKAPKEIDWSNAPIPVVGPRGIPAAAGGAAGTAAVSPLSATGSNSLAQGSNTAVGMHTYGGANAAAAAAAFPRGDSYQLPLDGSFDLQKVFFSGSHRQAAHGSADGQDEVVVRNPSPVLSSPSGVPPHQQSDFVVAGQKRANLLKKEKVTNTVLFM